MQYKKGQVLLIVVMLLATAITVVLSISFTTTTDTKITKLEEESQKALAAAEAGIEAALETKSSVPKLSDLAGLSGFTGSADLSTTVGKSFTSPLLQKDEQYTFYLDKYIPENSPPFENIPYNGTITVYYGSKDVADCSNIALELTLIYDSGGYKIKRLVSDSGDLLGANIENEWASQSNPQEKDVGGAKFFCRTKGVDISTYTGAKVLIVRALFGQTKIGFSGSDADPDFKPQGSFITSTATSSTGVTKKVQLFQSYPQIPSEFFVTRF